MDELVRRALLGDRKAQEECTRKKILLPCPKCYGNISICEYSDHIDNIEITFLCEKCGLMAKMTQKFAYRKSYRVPMTPDPFTQWNDRPKPPVGMCKDCGNTCPGEDNSYIVCIIHGHAVKDDGWCSEFEQKKKRCKDCVYWCGSQDEAYALCKDNDGIMEQDNCCKNFEPKEEK